MENDSLKNQLLIAMPQLLDPNFEHTLSYIVEHSEEGAMGLTLNRPVDLEIDDILEDLEIELKVPLGAEHQVVSGGPVQPEAGFILHPPTERVWQSSVPLQDGLWLTTSRDILEAIAAGEGPERSLTALGYAGWGAGQLEQEMADNAWLSTEATLEVIFRVPFSDRWQAAANQLGVDMALISTQAGHS
jgi:putative transcriptional regulator